MICLRWSQYLLMYRLHEHDLCYDPRLCYQLSSVIGSLGPSVVFGYRDILLTSGIFLACETQSVKLQQVSYSRFVGMRFYNVVTRNRK